MTTKTDFAANDIIGESVLAGIWLRTKPLRWFQKYAGAGTIPELFLLIIFFAFDYLLPQQRTETEALLKYTGQVYCVRTVNEFVFIACEKDTRQLVDVLRRFPSTALIACDFEHSHSTEVRFRFKSESPYTFHFEGVWSDLAEFINPEIAVANETGSLK
jgi:hypothetical protein